jgi:hypothetical protein
MMRRLIIIAMFVSLIASGVTAQDLATNTPVPTLAPTATEVTVEPEATIEATSESQVSVPIDDSIRNDGNGFEIVDIQIERTSHAIEQVAITIENIGEEPLDGVGWYLLAPSYIVEESWRFAAYVAPVELVTELEPGEQATLTFDGPDIDLSGEYKLSGWVHRVNEDGTTSHADGVGYDIPLVIGPDLFLTVDSVEWYPAPDADEGEYLLYVTFTLRNYTALPAEIAYSFTLATPDEDAPWETGVLSLPFESLILLPNSELELTTRDVTALPADEELEIVGYLQENVEGTLTFRSSYIYPTLIEIAG